jgi:hypothetical protein
VGGGNEKLVPSSVYFGGSGQRPCSERVVREQIKVIASRSTPALLSLLEAFLASQRENVVREVHDVSLPDLPLSGPAASNRLENI